MTTIHVAHSPDSDDAFMFYALAAGKIDTEGLTYVHELQDIETLNQRAMRGELEVTAVSIHAYAYLSDRYALLPHGASMGDRYGPRLVARDADVARGHQGQAHRDSGTAHQRVPRAPAVRAGLRGRSSRRSIRSKTPLSTGTVDVGLLIHEGQLTFADNGLHLIQDLGEWWFGETGLPLPLGGNVIRKDLGESTDAEDFAPSSRQHCVWTASIGRRRSTIRCSTRAASIDRRPTRSSACTSTTGRSTTAIAAARPSACSSKRGVEAGLDHEAGNRRIRRLTADATKSRASLGAFLVSASSRWS